MARQIEGIIGQEGAAKALWGLAVYSPARGRMIYAHNADRYFTPASVTKLFTTALALEHAGPWFTFRTVAGTRGRVDRHGRLLGDLDLVGGGDPDLDGCRLPYNPERERQLVEGKLTCDPTAVLDRLAAQVAARGVRRVTGNLVVDQSYFAPEPYPDGWAVGDLLWRYGAPVRALALADNTIVVQVEPGERPGDPARLSFEPPSRYYRFENRIRTLPEGGEALLYVRRQPGGRTVELVGSIALGQTGRRLEVAVEEPGLWIGELFLRALEKHGIRVEGELRVDYAPAPPATRAAADFLPVALAEHNSLPLLEDVRLINKVSQNLHAEMLLRLIGRSLPPEAELKERPRSRFQPPPRLGDASTEAGLEVLRAWLARAGIEPEDVELHDGSGLSRHNLVTPRAVIRLLDYAARQPWGEMFRDSLAVAGRDGTLEKRMTNSPARGRLRAKSGTLSHNSALAGYAETLAGETLYFAIFLNHHTLTGAEATQLIDRICEALVRLPAEESRKSKSENRNSSAD